MKFQLTQRDALGMLREQESCIYKINVSKFFLDFLQCPTDVPRCSSEIEEYGREKEEERMFVV